MFFYHLPIFYHSKRPKRHHNDAVSLMFFIVSTLKLVKKKIISKIF